MNIWKNTNIQFSDNMANKLSISEPDIINRNSTMHTHLFPVFKNNYLCIPTPNTRHKSFTVNW